MGTQYSIGKREQIAWVEEDGGYATLTANSMANDGRIVGFNAKVTPTLEEDLQKISNNGNDQMTVHSYEKGKRMANFTLEFTPYDWRFLKYCTHDTVTNTNMTTYYEHVFTQTASCKTFTLEWAKRQDTNQVTTLSGCFIKSYKMSFEPNSDGGFVKIVAECSAKDWSIGTAVTTLANGTPTEEPFKFYMGKFTYAGTEYTEVTKVEFNANTGVVDDDSFYANSTLSRLKGEPKKAEHTYDAVISVHHKDNTFINDVDGELVTGTHTLELTRGTNDDVAITLTGLKLKAAISPTNQEGVNVADLVMMISDASIVVNDQFSDY